ncbi:GGDEF domain-containing protein [Aureimonas ureilytica]|uniref:GGDEF domain-containing protein n=1 Tax=Aureimonas ureilytica TaxID=401562 RepID=UPI0012DFD6C7|nr:GGDEF domain-containing protein [Aureimonas ureilytica]
MTSDARGRVDRLSFGLLGRVLRKGRSRLPHGSIAIRPESSGLYTTLVAGLAFSMIPSSIMGLTILAVGLYAHAALGSLTILTATCLGGLASAAKVTLVGLHRRRLGQGAATLEEARVWELGHGATTCAMASSVGALSAGLFAQSDATLHMLATGLVFGYCSGVAARIFLRPKLAIAALLIAAFPAAVSALTFGGTPDRILGVIFLFFLGGSFESVRHLYAVSAEEIELRMKMAHLARTDALTGLSNRLAIQEAALWFPGGGEGFAAVHCFDLDDFKTVNDRWGHAAGDELLRRVADRLHAFLGERDIAIRTGGDEFVILQPRLDHPEQAEAFAMRLVEFLCEPYDLGDTPVRIGFSYGYRVDPAAWAELEPMLRAADAASYRAKQRGGGLERAA